MSQLDLFSTAPTTPHVAAAVACFEPSPCSVPDAPADATSSVLVPHVPECQFAAYALPDDDEVDYRRRMVRFPKVTSFAELFTEARSEDGIIPHVPWGDETISPFCIVSSPGDFRALYVRPAQGLIDLIKDVMILTGHGVHFHVVERDDGTALVLAQYQQILGSLWLAIVDPATVRASGSVAPAQPAKIAARKVRATSKTTAAEPTKRLDARQQELLAFVEVQDNRAVYLPTEHVPDWKALKLVVETLGGKWRTGGKNRRSGWDFPDDVDAAEVIRLAQESGEILDLKAAGLFETPVPLAEDLVRLAEIPPGAVVLEPSAGTGRIALAVRRLHPDARVLCCELLEQNRVELTRLGFELFGTDFLALDTRTLPPIDCVVANPPFAKFAEVDHIEHMLRCVRPGGRIATIAGRGVRFREQPPYHRLRALIEANDGTIDDCPDGSFAASGTGMRTVKITLRRAA